MTRQSAIGPEGRIVVVGASLAGLRACEELRRHEFSGSIVVIDAEASPFYDRPPLSKQFLAGDWEPDRVALREQEKLEALNLELRFSTRAVSLDVAGHTLTFDDGRALSYDGLVIATGASPRALPGSAQLSGLHVLRTLDEGYALRAEIEPGRRLVVVGGGFLGMEVAATGRQRGAEVVVIEPFSMPLERVLAPELGGALARLHREHGVDLRLGEGVGAINGDGAVDGVTLASGEVVPADVVLVAIGVIPSTDWLEGSGLEIDNGVVVDEFLVAGEDIVAAGDLARFPHPLAGGLVRLEHWTNAAEQGGHAALNVLRPPSERVAFSSVPYFWSDHYDLKIQAIGLPGPGDEIRVISGALDEPRFAVACGRVGRLVGVVGFGRPRDVMRYRDLLSKESPFEADPE